MNRRSRRELVNGVVAELGLAGSATYQQAARRVCELMSRRLGVPLEVRFVPLPDARLTGVSALLADGTYLVVCADSPRWYHRLQILLHEFAHLALGHQPVRLTRSPGPGGLPGGVLPDGARYLAARTSFEEREECEAEELADELLAAITDHRRRDDTPMPGHVRRIVASLAVPDDAHP